MRQYPTSQIHPKYSREFFNKGVQMTLNFLEQTLKGQNKVIDLKLPAQLHKLIDIKIGQQPISQTELLSECKKILEYQPKPYHPHFRNKLFGGFDQYSVMGAMMAPCINGTTYTYQIAPCFTIMQDQVYEHMRKIFQWEKMDAIMTPGGSFANFYGIELARHHKFPNIKQEGAFGMKPQVIYTSDVSHYSLQKGAILVGIGTNNVIKIKTDQFGRMLPSQLQKAILKTIEQGKTPLMVNATVGTTAQGSIDPVQLIADVCEKHKVWLHIDGALGGSFWISETLRKKAGSVKRADSVSWDPHKALLVPLQASIFFCKYENLMSAANSTNADCLFHRERASYDCSLDTGDKSLQCGRVIDILKLWVYFKGNGWKNIARQVESEHQLALFAKQYIQKNSDRFRMAITEVDTFNVCYWAIPKNLKREDFSSDADYYAMLSKVTVLAKKYMIEDGKILVGYQKAKGDYYFWRTVMSDPYLPKEELIRQIELTLQYCESSYAEVLQFKRKQQQRVKSSSEANKL